MNIIIYPQEKDDGLEQAIASNASLSYASCVLSSQEMLPNKKFKALASIDDKDLYYTQSILVSTTKNKNDDIFDKYEVWKARHTPADKPTNLEHDEGVIVGHIVSNYPITDDGILIDENTPIENLPEKYHILTGAVIYLAYSNPELMERATTLIREIEEGKKYVSMECFFTGFDYGLVNQSTGEYKIVERNDTTAYLTKYLRVYGGVGKYQQYTIGRVLRNITFSGKGYVNRPANPESIIFSRDQFKFLNTENISQDSNNKDEIEHEIDASINSNIDTSINNLKKNIILEETGVTLNQTNKQMEIDIMKKTQNETVAASEVEDTTPDYAAEIEALKNEIETLKNGHADTIAALEAEKASLEAEKNTLVSANEALVAEKTELSTSIATIEESNASKIQAFETEVAELKKSLEEAAEAINKYQRKDKRMVRKASLLESGFNGDESETIIDKFEALDDETFAAMIEVIKQRSVAKAEESTETVVETAKASVNIEEALEDVETEEEVVVTVGGEEASNVDTTRAALVDFVSNRLGKKTTK